ncbi:MAG: hypothetical protein FJW88_04260 [Actinobacteria bacterium]|nr:hypothetical protein [Actinomycetota bacterium]
MPAYPRRLINEGETVVLDLKPHWWFFLRDAIATTIVLGLFVVFLSLGDGFLRTTAKWVFVVAAVVWVGLVVLDYLRWTYTHFVVTDRRVISRSGIVSKHGTEIPLDRINNIDFHQRLIDRVIGAGDLDIESAGTDGKSHFDFVRHPDAVQQEIYRQIETNAKLQASWSRPEPAAAPVAGPPPDIADQIAKLASLRDQGAITSEEYEAKKAELLDRM